MAAVDVLVLSLGTAGVVAAAVDLARAWVAGNRDAAKQPEVDRSLEGRLKQLSTSMAASATLVKQIEAELKARAALATRLANEAVNAQQVLAMSQAARDAFGDVVRAQVETVTRAEYKRSNRLAIRLAAAGFVLGLSGTVVVTLLVHPLR